jgi:hypothetical protein
MEMIRPLTVAIALVSASAWATGERIQITGNGAYVAQLKETLCISMECVGKGQAAQANVIANVVKNELEVKVVGFDGRTRHIEKVAITNDRVSAFDLVSATSKLLAAIENPNARMEETKPSAKKLAKKLTKKQQQLANKKKGKRSFQFASR